MTDYNAKCLVPKEAPLDALKYAIDRTAREVADKVLGEIRNKECCVIRMDERQYDEPLTHMVAVNCRIYIDELVRCKDCRWWNEDEFPRAFPEKKTCMCECPNIYGFNHFGRFTQEDEFCSRGERREP